MSLIYFGGKMRQEKTKYSLVSGADNNPELVKEVGRLLRKKPVFFDTKPWPNGYPRLVGPENHSFAGEKVIIMYSMAYRGIGSPLEQLKSIADYCQHASGIYLILTYLCGKDDISHGYNREEKLPAICYAIRHMGFKGIYWFDPHHSSHIGLFYPVHHRRFYFLGDIINDARLLGINQVAAADDGSYKRACRVESLLKTGNPIIIATKEHAHQSAGSRIASHQMSGRLVGDKVGIFDDMSLGFGTIYDAAKILKEEFKAPEVYAATAHFDPTEEAYDRLVQAFDRGWLNAFTTTNSNKIDPKFLKLQGYGTKDPFLFDQRGFRTIDVSKKLARLVRLLVKEEPTSPLFDDI
jgi:phosphoribosylpyrophosphate synthetase